MSVIVSRALPDVRDGLNRITSYNVCYTKLLRYEVISNVSKAISVKSTMKALEGVKIKLSNDNLYLTGYDLELGIKA